MSKLDEIKGGDRVKVSFEAVAHVEIGSPDSFGFSSVAYDGRSTVVVREGKTWISLETHVSDPTFQIERIEPPLKVGDRVRYRPDYGRDDETFELVAFRDGQCLLWGPLESAMSSGRGAQPLYLERIP